MPKLNVLYITGYYKPAYVYGGTVSAVSTLCEALARQQVNITVMTTDANGAQRLNVTLGESINIDGVKVFYYPISSLSPRNYFYSPMLKVACAERISKVDVVIIDALWSYPLVATAQICTQARVPCVVPLHGQLMPWAINHRGWKKRLYLFFLSRTYLNKISAFHCASPAEVNSLVELEFSAPAFSIPYGIDTMTYADLPRRGGLRERLGISKNKRLVLVLGRLHRIKRPSLVLEALSLLPETNIHVVYAGPDEEKLEPDLRQIASKYGMSDRIHFTGMLDHSDIKQAFVDADFLAMPSVMESFGMAAAEALAAGLPILTSTEVPIGRWAAEVGAGLCVSSSAESFAGGIKMILASQEQLEVMGERGRIFAREHLDIRSVALAMQKQLTDIAHHGYLKS